MTLYVYVQSITERSVDIYLFNTNTSSGFRISFEYIYLNNGARLLIGTGNDPLRNKTTVDVISGYTRSANDVLVGDFEMWTAAVGGAHRTYGRVDMSITAVNVLGKFESLM